MSTAKPQQSTGQPDSSDDLIAELARMMATDTQPSSAAANAAAPEPQIVPQENTSAAVRIPGPPENAPAAEKFDFDFGAPPKAADALQPAPLVNWQDRLSRPAQPARQEPVVDTRPQAAPRVAEPTFAPQPQAEVAQERHVSPEPVSFIAPAQPVPVAPEPPKVEVEPEPVAEVAPQPQVVHQVEAEPEPEMVRAPEVDEPTKAEPVAFTSHDFDFGFGTAKISEPVSAEPPVAKAPVAETHDAIADLIAAQLGEPAEVSPPVEDAPQAPVEPAPVAKEPPAAKPFLRAVNFAAQPKPQGDRFAVSPVFGVGSNGRPEPTAPVAQAPSVAPQSPVESRPSQPVQQAPLDPMDEIESLIGSSIRHDIGNKLEPKGPASAIPTAREPSPIPRATARPIHDDHGAAEAAILAAAAASGAELGRVQQARAEERVRPEPARPAPAAKAPRARARTGALRPFIGLGVAAVLLVVAGGGLYWVLGNNQGTTGAAPVLTADTTPVKEPPPAVPVNANNPPASVVLNELSGGNATPATEQLVSRDQTGDTAAVAAIAPTETTGEEGLANRKVRTVTVRPDGTIVNSDDALAGAEKLPVDRPNVPAVPNASLDNSDLLSAAAAVPATTPSALTGTPVASAQPTALTPTPAAAVDPANVTSTGAVAPVPRPRMTNRPTAAIGPQPTNAVNAVVNTANDPIGALAAQALQPQTATPAPAATAPPATTSGAQPAAYVQLSSQRDENVARQSLIEINERYGKMLGTVLPEVQRVDLGAKGVYYRVRVPADSMTSANQLCDQIKSARGDCFVTN